MNSQIDDNYISRMYDDWTNERNTLMLELKNDKDLSKEKYITPKLTTIDIILKNLLKYRNQRLKEKIKMDGF